MSYTMLLETCDPWPEWPESTTQIELRAAVADLRHLTGFLASIGLERKKSALWSFYIFQAAAALINARSVSVRSRSVNSSGCSVISWRSKVTRSRQEGRWAWRRHLGRGA